MCRLPIQAVEGVMLLPDKKDFSQIGVKNTDLHFVTAGSKGSMAGRSTGQFHISCLLTSSFFPLLTSL